MRSAAAFLIFAILSGCDGRSSFDKQFDETANEIENRAARIDSDLNSTTTESEIVTEPSS